MQYPEGMHFLTHFEPSVIIYVVGQTGSESPPTQSNGWPRSGFTVILDRDVLDQRAFGSFFESQRYTVEGHPVFISDSVHISIPPINSRLNMVRGTTGRFLFEEAMSVLFRASVLLLHVHPGGPT
jgi:hypothetical protein